MTTPDLAAGGVARWTRLDPRPADEAESRPIVSAVNIPFVEIPRRVHELPARDERFDVVGPRDLGERTVDWLEAGESPLDEKGGLVAARGSALRELHAFLEKEDAGFGGLERVRNRRNEFLWVHPQFVGEY